MAKAHSPILFTPLFIALFSFSALADSVTLKDGTVIEGTIHRETEVDLVINVPVSASIMDEKTILKDNILSINRKSEDEVLYESLKGYRIGNASASKAGYDIAIEAISSFVTRFPESAHTAELKGNLTALQEERDRVEKGEVKWNNRWYSAEDASKLKYQIAADAALQQIKERASKGDLPGALNSFDLLEKSYSGSRAYVESIPLVTTIVQKLKTEMERAVITSRQQEKKFAEGIDSVGEPERSRLKAAHDSTLRNAEAAVVKAERANLRWMPLVPLSERAITSLRTNIASELTKLRAIDVKSMEESLAQAESASASLISNNLDAAESRLKKAVDLWKENELLEHIADAITLRRQAAEKLAAEEAAGKAEAEKKALAEKALKEAETKAATKAAPTPEEKKKKFFGLW